MSEMNELQILRHSASHVLAQAVKRLFSKSALCKDDYLKPKYLVDNSKYKIVDSFH